MLIPINNAYISRLNLIICSLIIFSGQLTINRFIKINGFIGGLKISFILMMTLLLILVIKNNFKKNNIILIIYKFSVVALLFNILIDLIQKRKINIEFNLDIIYIAVTSIFLCLCIKNKKDFLFFMRSTAILSIILGGANYFLWDYDRIILLTQISSNRIILFGLGAATLLCIENLKLENLLLVFALSFLATCGSLKVGLLAFALFIFISFTMLIIFKKFKATKLFILAVVLGVYCGYLNNSFEDIKSRINVVVENNFASYEKEANIISSSPLGTIDEYLAAECRESINYDYCISDKYTFRDSSERIRMWSHAINIIRSSPFFGAGIDGYNLRLAYRYPSGNNIYDYKYPHNIFLNIAVLFGLPFAVLIAIIIYLCFVLAIRVSIYSPEITGLVAAGAAIFLASNTGGDLYDARYIFLMCVLACLYCDEPNDQRLKSDLVKP